MENFEKYLLENRDELDRMEPLDENRMWRGIEGKVGSRSRSTSGAVGIQRLRISWKWLAIAATILALIGWSLFIFQPEEAFSLAEISPELAERELVLQRTIAQKENEIGIAQLDQEMFAEVFGELEELEANAAVARQDVEKGQWNERTLETLLRQYELKIRILETLSREIEKQKYHEELEKEI